MYAIVEIAGQQFKVSKSDKLFVNRLSKKEGEKISFDNVLLIDDGKNVKVGEPKLSGAIVNAKIIAHLKGDKTIVFKKKRRKGYRVKNGHRQFLTELLIEDVSENGAKTNVKSKTKELKSNSKDLKSKKTSSKKVLSTKPKSKSTKKSSNK
tara:strand:+ start:230 stop:682 length:453 start_codon:yes stop_codon:yes gene_type:complete